MSALVDFEILHFQMGAIHKMALVGVCGAFLYTGACQMYGWLRAAKKTAPSESYFCSFCWNTLRVILTDDLCVWGTWKVKPQKGLEQDLSIFFRIDDSKQCGTQEQRTTLQSGLHGDKACGCWRQTTPSLGHGFCLPLFLHRKGFFTKLFGFSGVVFAVISFCHRLKATSRLPDPAG